MINNNKLTTPDRRSFRKIEHWQFVESAFWPNWHDRTADTRQVENCFWENMSATKTDLGALWPGPMRAFIYLPRLNRFWNRLTQTRTTSIVATAVIFVILIIDEFIINAHKIHLKFDRFDIEERGPTRKTKMPNACDEHRSLRDCSLRRDNFWRTLLFKHRNNALNAERRSEWDRRCEVHGTLGVHHCQIFGKQFIARRKRKTKNTAKWIEARAVRALCSTSIVKLLV